MANPNQPEVTGPGFGKVFAIIIGLLILSVILFVWLQVFSLIIAVPLFIVVLWLVFRIGKKKN